MTNVAERRKEEGDVVRSERAGARRSERSVPGLERRISVTPRWPDIAAARAFID